MLSQTFEWIGRAPDVSVCLVSRGTGCKQVAAIELDKGVAVRVAGLGW